MTDIPGWITNIHDRNLSNAIRDPSQGGASSLRRKLGRVLRRLRERGNLPGAGPRQFSTQKTLPQLAEIFGFDPGQA